MVVVTSVGTEEQALDVAHALVRARRAACVNIIPNVHSVYRWKGRVCDDGEMLLIIKTRASHFEAVRETIHKVNTYELPEVLGYRVDWASPGFSSWIEKMTASRARPAEAIRKTPRSPAAPSESLDARGREGLATAASVAFLSLFLGLTSGDQQVPLAVQGRVAEVQLLLDGEEVARLDTPPWIAPIDLGPQLVPHELVARALDPQGGEVARARQWINMPRPPAEAGILLERDEKGRAVAARVTWENVMGEEPQQVTVSFDGRPIAMDVLQRVRIPAHSADVVHVVTVELDFASGLQSRDDVAFGGGAGGEAQSELTAVPIRMTKKRKLAPASFQGVLRAGEKPLRVATAEEGSASLWIVRDESATRPTGSSRGSGGRAARADRAASREGRRGQLPLAARDLFARTRVPRRSFPPREA